MIKTAPTRLLFAVLASSLLFESLFVGAALAQGSVSKVAQAQHRVLRFPAGRPIGVIFVGKSNLTGNKILDQRQVSGASGVVTLDLKPGEVVIFEANRRVFENPACLNEVSATGIDGLKLGFISLADEEDGMCDKALAYAKHFKDLKQLDVDRSEATDAGLAKLKDIKSLTKITTFLSSVAGESFKELSTLPELKTLEVPKCSIDKAAFSYLPKFPKLESLNVSITGLDENGAKYLARCSNLRDLAVRGNVHFNDSCLKSLQSLKKLESLDVRDTAVTASGVKTFLSVSNVKQIQIPSMLARELPSLRSRFPGIQIYAQSAVKSMSEQDQKVFAPLK